MKTFKTIFIRVISAVLIFLIIGFLSGKFNKVYAASPVTSIYLYSTAGYQGCLGTTCNVDYPGRFYRMSAKSSYIQVQEGGRYNFHFKVNIYTTADGVTGPYMNGVRNMLSHDENYSVAVNQTSSTYNTVPDSNGFNRVTWDFYGYFNSTFTTTGGIGFDWYYFNESNRNSGVVKRIEVIDFEIVNTGNNVSDSINNMSNNIINNQNNNTQNIINNQNANTDKINNTLTDDNIDESQDNFDSFFNNFNQDSHGLSGVITAPLDMLRAFTTAQCSPLVFNLPIVHNRVVLPCMRPIYEEYFGIFFSLWQLITTGLISYNVCINLYSKIRALSNPYNDRIEVLNL